MTPFAPLAPAQSYPGSHASEARPDGTPLLTPRCSGAQPAETERHAEIRRRNRIKLLRDLVSHGLYRVPVEALAERLVPVLRSASHSGL